MAERSKARVCGLSFVGVVDSNLAGGMDVCVVGVFYCNDKMQKSGQSSNKNE